MYLLFMLPAFVISLLAQLYISYAFSRWNRVPSPMTGRDVAERIITRNGLHVRIERYSGFLTDHYDPRSRTIRLSPTVHDSMTVSAVAVAAHETGHAIQHHSGYVPLKLRNSLVPVVSFGSQLAWILLFIGFMLNLAGLILAGLVFFSFSVLFALVTLPVEFDASWRAMKELDKMGLMNPGVKEVLVAAALTYVAAFITSLLQMMYYLLVFLSSRDE